MRRVIFITLLLVGVSGFSQEVKTDEQGMQYFEMKEGDTTYLMKQYFIVFLKKGEKRNQSKVDGAEIQKDHLAHITWMAEQGYVDLAGPFGDDGDIRGILVMRVPTMERAEELANMDPAVKAGRLTVEVHPWWAAAGSSLK